MHSTVLFDLDGTLSDPLPGIGRSINHALTEHGFAPEPLSVLADCVGPPLDQSFMRLTGVDDRELVHALVMAYRERYLDVGYRENALYPDVVDTLTYLQGAGLHMALCTSKPEAGTRLILEHFGIGGFFAFISCGDIGVEKWQQLRELCDTRTIDSGALMIGDRAVDIQAGQRNGLSTGAVTWGYGSQAELSGAQPLRWFHTPLAWRALSGESEEKDR